MKSVIDANDPQFYFDEAAADRPLRFIAKYLQINEDKYSGPMQLLPWQVEITRNLFGWKWKKNNTRRFKNLFLFIAKGNGKTPFLAAIGMYAFCADLDPRTHKIRQGVNCCSVASNFKQASISYGSAKKFVTNSAFLSEQIEITKYEIRNPATGGNWTIFSGTPQGKQGFQYNVMLADELHEWEKNGKEAFEHVRANLIKRDDTLNLMATNCGNTKDGLCYELWDYSKKVEANPEYDLSWYPVLYEAPLGCSYTDEEAWEAANPSLDVLVTSDNLREAANQVKGDKYKEQHFRRFNLSQWPDRINSKAWLSMIDVDACMRTTSERHELLAAEGEELSDLPLWMGLDLSLTDDLSALAYLYVGQRYLYADVDSLITRRAANEYEDMGVPYGRWEDQGDIEVVESQTIDAKVKEMLLERIVAKSRVTTFQGLLYDPARASDLIVLLEEEGILCIPQSQSIVNLAAPTMEFERRVKEHTIILPVNGCLRWQCENACITSDNNGLIRLAKPGMKGTYAGTRSKKIDSLAAMVFSLARLPLGQAKKETDEERLAKRKQWSGEMMVL